MTLHKRTPLQRHCRRTCQRACSDRAAELGREALHPAPSVSASSAHNASRRQLALPGASVHGTRRLTQLVLQERPVKAKP